MSKFIKQSKLLTESIDVSLRRVYEDTNAANPNALKRRAVLRQQPSIIQDEPSETMPEHQPGKLEVGSSEHAEHFAHPNTKFNVQALSGGANNVFHATSHDNKQYIIKPHADTSGRIDPEHWHETGHSPSPRDWEEPEHWGARNAASNRVLDSMGMSHMGVHTFSGHVPGSDQMGVNAGHPLADHHGRPAQVSVFDPNAIRLNKATPEQLDKVDAHHRLTGLVHGILTNNPDAHHGNVMLNTKNNHPVHIADNDLSFASRMQRHQSASSDANPEGHQAVMSVYGPGESLDYRRGKVKDPETGQDREMGEVGHNYPSHIMNTLNMAAAGRLGHGLSDADHATMIKNAGDLLHHGLEGTMKRRHMLQTYVKQKEPAVLPNEKTTSARKPGNKFR